MPIRQPSRTTTRSRARSLLAAGAALAAALPLVLATPSQAAPAPASSSDDDYSCTVKAKKPYYTGHHKWGKKVVDYPISIYCDENRYLNIKQQRWEYDNEHERHDDGHDYLGHSSWHKVYVKHDKWVTLHSYKVLEETPYEDEWEEVFHKVKYQEWHHDAWTHWSGWDSSHYTPIHH
jgi:hypothetical protein